MSQLRSSYRGLIANYTLIFWFAQYIELQPTETSVTHCWGHKGMTHRTVPFSAMPSMYVCMYIATPFWQIYPYHPHVGITDSLPASIFSCLSIVICLLSARQGRGFNTIYQSSDQTSVTSIIPTRYVDRTAAQGCIKGRVLLWTFHIKKYRQSWNNSLFRQFMFFTIHCHLNILYANVMSIWTDPRSLRQVQCCLAVLWSLVADYMDWMLGGSKVIITAK